MRVLHIALFLSSLIHFSLCCSAQSDYANCGVVISRVKFLDTISQEYISSQIYWPDHKIWYKDSLVIEEIPGIYIKRNTTGQEWRKIEVLHYTFIDLRSWSFYNYNTFSDTAKVIKRYTQPDSLNVPGGSTFYVPRDVPVTEPPIDLSDTLIGRTLYRRVKFINKANNTVMIGYLRCDKRGTLFQYYKLYGKMSGCPLVRIDDLPTSQYPIPTSAQVEFVSDTLTAYELKVFSAWERNAINNPVK